MSGAAADRRLYSGATEGFWGVGGEVVFDELLLADARSGEQRGLEMGRDIRRERCSPASSGQLRL